ncbi:MAG: hypothetical protein JWM25_886 [Thermoleophilia bacterium]|nr:hypothetical protein [Thermoleophilia bacterium]
MQITPTVTTPPTAGQQPSDWTNPAAAAALRSTVDMLANIEAGIVRDFTNVDRVRGYAYDLRSTIGIFEAATTAITSDSSVENDSFLPLLGQAGGGVSRAEHKLSAKDLNETWAGERSDILAAIRQAKNISHHVADQLDPRSVRQPRPSVEERGF